MRNIWLAFLIVLFAVVVTKPSSPRQGATPAGTSPRGGTTNLSNFLSTGGVYCTIVANASHADRAGQRIVASGRFRCDRPGPDSLAMTVALQKRGANGQWATVASQRFTASRAATTRDHSDADRTRQITAGCAPGVYRTVINGSSVSQKKTRTYTMTSPTATDPCPRPRAGR